MGGLIGTATAEKNGLMSAIDKKNRLGSYNVGNRAFIKIINTVPLWIRKSVLIYGDYDGNPYMVLIGIYAKENGIDFNIRWITGQTPMLKFYKNKDSINAFFDLSMSAPQNAFIQSIDGTKLISNGVYPSSEYTEIIT